MTHDELLAKIDTLEARYTDYPTYLAFRAVVELHKPEGWPTDPKCYECQGLDAIDWPCQTIRAIEKQLS